MPKRTQNRKNQNRKIQKSKKNNPLSIIIVIAGIIIAGLFTGNNWDAVSEFFGLSETASISGGVAGEIAEGAVQVHFIDVGQGDCALILTNQKSVLIDSGDKDYANKVIQYIRKMGVNSLDLVIVSHPHADHMGAMSQIIETINVKKLLLPQLPDELVPTTNVFVKLLDAIENYSVEAAYPDGKNIDLGSGAVIEIFSPGIDRETSGVNDYSLIVRLNHGSNAFIFTGDAEKAAENVLLKRNIDLSADVLKVAHHGSRTSSTRSFLEAVNGKYAVISVGSPNRYNHPNDDIIKRLKQTGYEILRTDKLGTIVFESNTEEGLKLVS